MRATSMRCIGHMTVVLGLQLLAASPVRAQTDMPSAAEVREALETLRRFERALANQTPNPDSASWEASSRLYPTQEALTTSTVAAGSSAPTVAPPGSYSLSLDGDVSLGGFVFKEGYPFLHNEGGHYFGNVALGSRALESVTPYPYGAYLYGGQNTAIGGGAMAKNTSGLNNTAVGYRAMHFNTTGYYNTALGRGALSVNTTGSRNTAVGQKALGLSVTGFGNTAIGDRALSANTSASRNTALGRNALTSNKSANNTALGYAALRDNETGANNTAIGYGAALLGTGADWSTAIGVNAGQGWTTGDDNIAIGSGAVGAASDSGVIRIGGAGRQSQTFIEGIDGTTATGGSQVFINSSNQLGTNASSARFKQDIHDVGGVSDRLQKLRAVSFRYKDELAGSEPGAHNPLEYGLIAEEVAEIFPELVANDEEGKPYTVRYHLLTPLLLAEVQRQADEIADLRRTVDQMRRSERLVDEAARYSQIGRGVQRERRARRPDATHESTDASGARSGGRPRGR